MNEEKLNPMLGYDKEQDKPKLLNNDAIFLCVEFIKNPEKEIDNNCHFNVDDDFLEHMANEGWGNPSQDEVNKFVLNMIKDCSEVEEEELPKMDDILHDHIKQKIDGIDDKDVPMGC